LIRQDSESGPSTEDSLSDAVREKAFSFADGMEVGHPGVPMYPDSADIKGSNPLALVKPKEEEPKWWEKYKWNEAQEADEDASPASTEPAREPQWWEKYDWKGGDSSAHARRRPHRDPNLKADMFLEDSGAVSSRRKLSRVPSNADDVGSPKRSSREPRSPRSPREGGRSPREARSPRGRESRVSRGLTGSRRSDPFGSPRESMRLSSEGRSSIELRASAGSRRASIASRRASEQTKWSTSQESESPK
jgi:hypothetical protein